MHGHRSSFQKPLCFRLAVWVAHAGIGIQSGITGCLERQRAVSGDVSCSHTHYKVKEKTSFTSHHVCLLLSLSSCERNHSAWAAPRWHLCKALSHFKSVFLCHFTALLISLHLQTNTKCSQTCYWLQRSTFRELNQNTQGCALLLPYKTYSFLFSQNIHSPATSCSWLQE